MDEVDSMDLVDGHWKGRDAHDFKRLLISKRAQLSCDLIKHY